jgi:hypothetical protein
VAESDRGFEPDDEGARLDGVNEGYLVARLLEGDSVDALEPLFPNVLEEERRGNDVYSGAGEGTLWESATETEDDLWNSEKVRDSLFSTSEVVETSWEGDPLDVESSITGLRSDSRGILEYLRDDLPFLDGWDGGWGSGGWEECCADSCE